MRRFPFYLLAPVFLAIYPILFFYSINYFLVDLADVTWAMLFSLGVAGLLAFVLRLFTRNLQRSLWLTSLLLMLFYGYGHVFNLAQNLRHLRFFPFDKHPWLLGLWALLLIGGLIFVFRSSPARLKAVNRFVGILCGALLLLSLSTIIVNALTAGPPEIALDTDVQVQAPANLPDIYYIILDEYAGNSTLLDSLGYDNREFTDSLSNRGFYVAREARSNYYMTPLSLASSLNMEYLEALYGHRGEDLSPAIALVKENAVAKTMKRLGYTYVYFGTSRYAITNGSSLADIIYNGYDKQRIKLGGLVEIDPPALNLDDFHLTLAATTLLLPFTEKIELDDSRIRNQYMLDKLAEIPDMPEPTFTFAHVLLPHPPYVFDRADGPVDPNGRSVDGGVVDQAKYAPHADYIDQIVFTNRAVSQLVDTLLENSPTEPIILIQGDHGFRWLCSDCYTESKSWDDAHYVDVVLPILSAYYLPNDGSQALYPTISPVNSFRVIFDYYFSGHMELLADRHFRPEDYYSRPYYFQDITDLVVAAQERQ